MTGLLRSLGAQALDHVPALRPAVRMRGAAMLWTEQARDRAPDNESAAADAASIAVPSSRGTTAPAPSLRARKAQAHVARDDAPDIARAERTSTTIATREAMNARNEAPRSPLADQGERRVVDAAGDNDADRARRPARREPRASVTMTARTIAKPAHRRETRVRFDDPLASARPEREPAPPDVQIHIGRIELTAVTAPASAPRATPQGRKPMSLDDYLRERKRKTP